MSNMIRSPHSWGIKFVGNTGLPDPHYHYDDDLGFGYYDEFWEPVCCEFHINEYERRGRDE